MSKIIVAILAFFLAVFISTGIAYYIYDKAMGVKQKEIGSINKQLSGVKIELTRAEEEIHGLETQLAKAKEVIINLDTQLSKTKEELGSSQQDKDVLLKGSDKLSKVLSETKKQLSAKKDLESTKEEKIKIFKQTVGEDFFTVGSTQEDVRTAQGAPTAISGNSNCWSYGQNGSFNTAVCFGPDGRVKSYLDEEGILKVK
jgi:hypothetical protein